MNSVDLRRGTAWLLLNTQCCYCMTLSCQHENRQALTTDRHICPLSLSINHRKCTIKMLHFSCVCVLRWPLWNLSWIVTPSGADAA